MTPRTDAAWEPSPVRPFSRIDLYAALAIFVLSWILAALYQPTFRAGGGKPQFYQADFAPAVMWACGRGYVNVDAKAIHPLDDFLNTRVESFSCDALPAKPREVQLGLMPSVCRYLMLSTAVVWRVAGVSWPHVELLLSTMFAFTIAAAFLALRFVAGRTLAAIGATLWAVSPMHLANLPHLRDYSKTPFLVLTAIASAIAIAERRTAWLIVTGLVFGLVQGAGFGMRTDVILNFVPFLAALALAGPRDWREQLGAKIGAAAGAIVVFLIVASPLFGIYGTSDGLSHVALLGMTTPFDQPLGVRPAPYDFGSQYSDTYVSAEVSGDWLRRHPGAAAVEPGGALLADASRDYYVRLIETFPGDTVTRTTGAVIQTLNLPFQVTYGAWPLGVTNDALVWLGRLRTKLMLALIGTGPAVAALLLFVIGWSRRRDLCVAFSLLMFLGAYPVIQFHGRHTFPLEMLVIGIFLWLASLAVRAARSFVAGQRPSAAAVLRSAGLLTGLVVWCVVAIVATRLWQAPAARTLLDRYERAATDPLRLTPAPAADGRTRLSADVFDATPGRRTRQALLVASVLPSACAKAPDVLTIRYLQGGQPAPVEYDFSTTMTLPATVDGRIPTRVFVPVYEINPAGAAPARFSAVEVAAGAEACVHLSRVRGLDDALWLDATLTPGWRERPLNQRLYIALLFPERLWLKIARWWPSFAALG